MFRDEELETSENGSRDATRDSITD